MNYIKTLASIFWLNFIFCILIGACSNCSNVDERINMALFVDAFVIGMFFALTLTILSVYWLFLRGKKKTPASANQIEFA